MAAAPESSVLFALQELRESEQERARQLERRRQEQSALARRQAEAAQERRRQEQKNTDELVLLREQASRDTAALAHLEEQLAASARGRVRLEARLQDLQQAQLAMPTAPPPRARWPHLAWAGTMLLACLAVFVASYRPEASVQAPRRAEQSVATAACIESPEQAKPSPASETSPASASLAAAATDPSPRPASGKPGSKTPSVPRKPPHPTHEPLHIDLSACDGPLCGLPD